MTHFLRRCLTGSICIDFRDTNKCHTLFRGRSFESQNLFKACLCYKFKLHPCYNVKKIVRFHFKETAEIEEKTPSSEQSRL